MTPEREAYLKKCSKREMYLRTMIKVHKRYIGEAKWRLRNDITFDDEDIEFCKNEIRTNKWKVSVYRHKLARLKGMDRVVVPRNAIISPYTDMMQGYCVCGRALYEVWHHNYCSNCGRRILWGEVNV